MLETRIVNSELQPIVFLYRQRASQVRLYPEKIQQNIILFIRFIRVALGSVGLDPLKWSFKSTRDVDENNTTWWRAATCKKSVCTINGGSEKIV